MTDERQRRMMQEALDSQLTAESLRHLREELDRDPAASLQFGRLKKVDDLLRDPPLERAPSRLALSIMAKLAQMAQPEEVNSQQTGLATALGLSMVVVVALPAMAAAVALFLNAAGSSSALAAMMQQVANLMALIVSMLDMLVKGAQSVLASYPQAALLMVTVTPIVLFWLLRALDATEQNQQSQA
jgi:hypothetical protein